MQSELEFEGRGLRDRILLIKAMDAFVVLDDEGQALLAEYARERPFPSGTALLREGDPIRNVYFLMTGRVEVRRRGKLVATVERGRPVGVLSVLARDNLGVDAIALTDVVALEIPVTMFLSAYEDNFSVVRNGLHIQSRILLKTRGNLPIAPEHAEPPQMGVWRDREETLVERIIKAREAPLFRNINLDAVVDLCRRMKEQRFEAGHTLWQIGERGAFHFRIDYGHIRCTNADGNSVVIGAGWVIGSMDVLGDHPRSYGAVTETEVIGIRIDAEAMFSVLESNIELAMDMIAMLSGQLLAGN